MFSYKLITLDLTIVLHLTTHTNSRFAIYMSTLHKDYFSCDFLQRACLLFVVGHSCHADVMIQELTFFLQLEKILIIHFTVKSSVMPFCEFYFMISNF